MTLDEITEVNKELLAARYEAAVAERSATLSGVRIGVAGRQTDILIPV